jgi:hypothetical protein
MKEEASAVKMESLSMIPLNPDQSKLFPKLP